jgi:hypothetical protein
MAIDSTESRRNNKKGNRNEGRYLMKLTRVLRVYLSVVVMSGVERLKERPGESKAVGSREAFISGKYTKRQTKTVVVLLLSLSSTRNGRIVFDLLAAISAILSVAGSP